MRRRRRSRRADPRDALIAAQAERIAALEALVADLREQLAAALRAGSRNSGNSSMPPSSDDLPGRKPPRKQRRAAERAEKKRKRGKQPGSPGASMTLGGPGPDRGPLPAGRLLVRPGPGGRGGPGRHAVVSAGGDPGRAGGAGPARPARGALRLRPDACRGPPGGRAGLRPVHRAAAACPGRLPGGLPACPGGAVPAADRRRDRRRRLGRVHPLLPGDRRRPWPRTWCG